MGYLIGMKFTIMAILDEFYFNLLINEMKKAFSVVLILCLILLLSSGDGAGVGKGRTIAAIIYENYLLMRKRAIWLSVSNDLKFDSERDLRDVGAGKITVGKSFKF